jgi:hypothetical protein
MGVNVDADPNNQRRAIFALNTPLHAVFSGEYLSTNAGAGKPV